MLGGEVRLQNGFFSFFLSLFFYWRVSWTKFADEASVLHKSSYIYKPQNDTSWLIQGERLGVGFPHSVNAYLSR